MKALAVVTPSLFEVIDEKNKHLMEIDDLKIPLALVEGNAPEFDPESDIFKNSVLVQKKSFSLNYRDLGIMEMAWNYLKDKEVETYYPIGSDFSGYVIKVGKDVTRFSIGDLVIGDCAFPDFKEGVNPGIPSNHSSREFEVYNQLKLCKVPDYISAEDAGALSIGTQTSMSMLKKGAIKKGNNVLVTSITSNTSFFLLNTLWGEDCNVYGLSYSGENIQKVKDHFPFIKEVFSVSENNIPKDILFDVVFDAFSDTYLEYLIPCLNFNARYVTCGIFKQSSHKMINSDGVNLSALIVGLMMKNISLIGNCLGSTQDLVEGLQNYRENKMFIDTVFTEENSISDFISRSYNLNKDKFGKVVFVYENKN
ncbi:MDR/zinc-dependent alcohol dehydrogenase-like family protein [Flavobacterium terrae]|uniref:NADPH:quinone reductase n=1 Tax=Flavobacterium terrae TaxID=415425 RepID=A0A1M6AE14_9FLAO|nr:medium chain dehydrogenase/reductase family protein [Flavobacterium terrae]SHI34705.1 NADPH:quinone reductase [Flavobacterium terrae]